MLAMPLDKALKVDSDRLFYMFMERETFWVGFVRKVYHPNPHKTWHMTGYVSVDKKDWHEADRLKDLTGKHQVSFESVGSPLYHIPSSILEHFNGTDHNFWIGVDYFQAESQPTEDQVAARLCSLLGAIYE